MTVRPAPPEERARTNRDRLEAAAEAGRRLAAQIGTPDGRATDPIVESMARAGIPRLRQLGVDAEVLRARPGCLVVRSSPRSSDDVLATCALVSGWLEALPGVAHGAPATVNEPTCAARGARSCIHTLVWRDEPVPRAETAEAPPSPAPPTSPPPPTSPAPPASPALPPGHVTAPAPWVPTPLVAAQPPQPRLSPLTPQPPRDSSVPQPEAPPPPPAAFAQQPSPAPDPPPAATARPAAEVAFVDPAPTPARAMPRIQADADRAATDASRRPAPPQQGQRLAWLRRRAWLVLVGALAGSLGGAVASTGGVASYSATAVVVVQSAGSTAATASANGAAQLAITYAALIPQDQALLDRLAGETHLPATEVPHHLSVQAEAGTALIQLRFTAPTATAALAGANDVARALASANPPGQAIAAGTVSVVTAARTASHSGTLRKYGLPLGVVLGLVVGVGAALVAERTDRRVDDLESLGETVGCPSTWERGGISSAELAGTLRRAGAMPVTVVPLRAEQARAAAELAAALTASCGSTTNGHARSNPIAEASRPFADAPETLSRGAGPTVVVVGAGERAGVVHDAGERLRLVGRDPVWAVLVPAGGMRRVAGRGS